MINIGWLPKRCTVNTCELYPKCAISSCHHMAPSREAVFIPEVDLTIGKTGITVHCMMYREKEVHKKNGRRRQATRKRG